MDNIKPFIKWVGGKTQLLDELKTRLPEIYDKYYEPFIGGGALLFSIQPEKAIINDYNKEVSNLYNIVKNKPNELISDLQKHENTESYFYAIRSLDRNKKEFNKLSDVERASRFVYLNKTCYNGLYRVNRNDEFNVPFGKYKNPLICDNKNIINASRYLKNVEILNLDFEEVLKTATSGDFVYLDPPYDVISKTASFTEYNKDGFSKEDQIRVKKVCDNLTSKNVKWMLSNANTQFIKNLYSEYNIEIVDAKRSINSKGYKRTGITEVIIRNYV